MTISESPGHLLPHFTMIYDGVYQARVSNRATATAALLLLYHPMFVALANTLALDHLLEMHDVVSIK